MTAQNKNQGDDKATVAQERAEAVKPREGVTTDRAAEATQAAQADSSAPIEPGAVVLGTRDAVEHFDDLAGEALVTLSANVYETFYFPDTTRPSYRLLYTKGQVVRKSVIDALNAEKTADLEAARKANPANIDSSTLASGTNHAVTTK